MPKKMKKTKSPGTSAVVKATARLLAEDILEHGMKTPIQVRKDDDRYVLVEGLHRLEAARFLGETAIEAYLVQARRH